jgi:hypothetical protein
MKKEPHITISFPDDGQSVRFSLNGLASANPEQSRAAATAIRVLFSAPAMRRLVAAALDESKLPLHVAREVAGALEAAAGPAVTPFEVL